MLQSRKVRGRRAEREWLLGRGGCLMNMIKSLCCHIPQLKRELENKFSFLKQATTRPSPQARARQALMPLVPRLIGAHKLRLLGGAGDALPMKTAP